MCGPATVFGCPSTTVPHSQHHSAPQQHLGSGQPVAWGGCPGFSGGSVAIPARLWYRSGVQETKEQPPMKRPLQDRARDIHGQQPGAGGLAGDGRATAGSAGRVAGEGGTGHRRSDRRHGPGDGRSGPADERRAGGGAEGAGAPRSRPGGVTGVRRWCCVYVSTRRSTVDEPGTVMECFFPANQAGQSIWTMRSPGNRSTSRKPLPQRQLRVNRSGELRIGPNSA